MTTTRSSSVLDEHTLVTISAEHTLVTVALSAHLSALLLPVERASSAHNQCASHPPCAFEIVRNSVCVTRCLAHSRGNYLSPVRSAMGAHESNKGLCRALYRMFTDLSCMSALTVSSDSRSARQVQERAAQARECRQIADRFAARGCEAQGDVDLRDWARRGGPQSGQ